MVSRLIEVTAIPLQERFRRDQFAIYSAKAAPPIVEGLPLQFGLSGESEAGEFSPGVSYRFYGHWDRRQEERYGPTFAFNSFCSVAPHGHGGVVAYLQQCRYVGQVTAELLWDEFGPDAVRVLREEPQKAAEILPRRFGIDKATAASEDLKRLQAAENVTIALMDLFEGRKFGKSCVKQAITLWGAEAVDVLRRDPYKSLALRGVGFAKADQFYLDLGKPPGKLKRQALCMAYGVQKRCDQEGHVWIPLQWGVDLLRASIASDEVKADKALRLSTRGRLMVSRTDAAGNIWIAERTRANAERYICERIVDAMYWATEGVPIPEWEERETVIEHKVDHTRCARCNRRLTAKVVHVLRGTPYGPECIKRVDHDGYEHETVDLEEWLDGLTVRETVTTNEIVGAQRILSGTKWPDLDLPEFEELEKHQREELAKALSGPVGILGGRPGTGKSFTLVRLVRALIRLHGADQVRVMAPTGKAAQRVKELMAEAELAGVEPTTIHRGLGVESSDGGWSFKHRETNPLPCSYVVLEEGSMVGDGLFRSLIAALPKGCCLLIVGDVNQLTPVEYGAPLRDMIEAGVPYGELREIHRNSGSIVRVCSAIVDQKPWEPDDRLDLQLDIPKEERSPKNLVLIPAGRAVAAEKVKQLLCDIRDRSPFDAVWDTQVIVAVNKKSPLSRVELNKQLQQLLNPAPSTTNGNGRKVTPFRAGDKVICLKNSTMMLATECGNEWTATEEKTLVANGEIGRVVVAEERKTIVAFPQEKGERVVFVPRGTWKSGGDENGDGEGESVDTGCDLDLAYAVTCHKLQGSQAPVVIVCVDEHPGATGQYGVCDRSWLYTALSRAQVACFMVGMKHVANSMCNRTFINRRKTFMAEDLRKLASKAGVLLRMKEDVLW